MIKNMKLKIYYVVIQKSKNIMSMINNKNIIFFPKMWFCNDLNECKRMFSEIMCVSRVETSYDVMCTYMSISIE